MKMTYGEVVKRLKITKNTGCMVNNSCKVVFVLLGRIGQGVHSEI